MSKQKRNTNTKHCANENVMYPIAMNIKDRLKEDLKKDHKSNIVYIRISDATMDEIKALQEQLGIKNRSELLRVLIEDHLANMKKEEQPA